MRAHGTLIYLLAFAMAAVVILAGIAWVSLRTTGESAEDSRAAVKRAQTLPPEMFTDPAAREAYQAAKEVPEGLEQQPATGQQHHGERRLHNDE